MTPPLPERFDVFPGVIPMQCARCRHFRRDLPGATCAAFPEGIPRVILLNEHDHRAPYPGDHGVRWEPGPGETWDDHPGTRPHIWRPGDPR